MEDISNQLLQESERSRLVLLSLLEDQKNAEEALRLRHETTKKFQKIISELAVSPFLIQGSVKEFSALLNEKVAFASNIDRVSVWIFNEPQTELCCVDLFERSKNLHSGGSVLKQEEFENEFHALKTDKFVNADNPLTDPRTSGYVDGYLIPNHITSMLDSVIRLGGKHFGTVCFEYIDTPHHWEAEEIAFGSQLADQISITLYNNERIKTLQTLEQNEAKFRTVADFTYDWEYWESEEGTIVYMSPSCERITGYTQEQFISDPQLLQKIVHPVDVERVIRHHKKDYTINYRNLVDELEFRIKKSDGSIIFLHHICRPIIDGSQKFLGRRVCNRDITDRKYAETALQESENTFRKLFEESADPILLLDNNGFFECNQATLSLLGYSSKEEFLNKQPWEVSPEIQPDGLLSPEKARMMIDKAIKEGYNRFEWIHLRADGTEIPVEVMLTSIIFKGTQTFYTIWRDITDRKQSEIALKESELKYRELVENSPDAIAIYVEGKIVFVNNECVKLMAAKNSAELIGKSVIQFVHPAFRGFVAERMKRAVSENIVLPPAEERFIRLNGTEVDVEVKAMAIRFEHKPAVQLIVRDITDRKRMTEELIASKEAAERANSVKDGFIANMSHEIRTPLNGILGMTSIIKDSLSQYVTEDEEPFFEGIETSSQRIIRTVDMILNFSRLKSGDFPIAPKEINLTSICEGLHKEFFLRAKTASLNLSFENHFDNAILLNADEYSVTHAISNLIDNAIKYTKKGFITLILCSGNDGEVHVKVKDSGIGMKSEYLVHLFEPYRQEEMGYGRAYEGVGLGLSLVKQFLALNHARIAVESEKDFGTTFTITFNYAKRITKTVAVAEKLTAKVELKEQTQKQVVLIVEDDLINQITITNFLASKYKTLVIASSDEAVDVLKSNNVDLILMDISIRGSKNGLELTKELKLQNEFRHIPIIAITAHAFDKDRQNSLAAGCDEYLSKPFTKDELLTMLANF